MDSGCFNLHSSSTQIKFQLKKFNSNSIQILKMFVQTCPNIDLDKTNPIELHPYPHVGMAIFWANRVTRPGPPLLGRV